MKDFESVVYINLNKYKHLNDARFEKFMKKYKLRKIDIEILVYLSNIDEHNTARDIVASGMYTKGHVSQSVKRMTEMGYVTSVVDKEDMRIQHIVLTKKAKGIMGEIIDIKTEIEEKIMKGVTEEEKEVLANVMKKIYENIINAYDYED